MGKLYVIGVGNGNYYDLTLRTINILNDVDLMYCDEKIFLCFIPFSFLNFFEFSPTII